MANQPSDLRPGDDPRPNPPYGLWHNLRGANGQDAGVVSTPLRAAPSPVGSILSSFRGFLFHRVHFVLAAARELTAVSKECWKILTWSRHCYGQGHCVTPLSNIAVLATNVIKMTEWPAYKMARDLANGKVFPRERDRDYADRLQTRDRP